MSSLPIWNLQYRLRILSPQRKELNSAIVNVKVTLITTNLLLIFYFHLADNISREDLVIAVDCLLARQLYKKWEHTIQVCAEMLPNRFCLSLMFKAFELNIVQKFATINA